MLFRFVDHFIYNVEWVHNLTDEPIILISEIDENIYELRKIKIYKNGKVGFATEHMESMDTKLSEFPLPSVKKLPPRRIFT